MNGVMGTILYVLLIVINATTFYRSLNTRRTGIMFGDTRLARSATMLCIAAALLFLWCVLGMSYYITKI